MLILKRKAGQSIVTRQQDGTEVKFRVLAVGEDGQVKVGIEAPCQVRVIRAELLEQSDS